MPDLASLQAMMKAAILKQDHKSNELELVIAGRGLMPDARLNIHRNTLRLGLIDCLMQRYPACRAFVGDDFWRAVARSYVVAHPPHSACLNEYGDGMADYLSSFTPVRDLPYLADLAKLEWLIHDLQGKHEGVSERLESIYPVFDLWRAGMGQIAPESVSFGTGKQSVMIFNREGRVEIELA